jgi:hypothetical protein
MVHFLARGHVPQMKAIDSTYREKFSAVGREIEGVDPIALPKSHGAQPSQRPGRKIIAIAIFPRLVNLRRFRRVCHGHRREGWRMRSDLLHYQFGQRPDVPSSVADRRQPSL